jgi:PAS domain S-box-containing protein
MKEEIAQPHYRRIAFFSALFVIAGGLTVLIGWQTDTGFLKSVFPGIVPMNPVTAICFLLAGISLVFYVATKGSRMSRAFMLLPGVVLVAVGAVRLIGIIGGPHVDFHFDLVLYHRQLALLSQSFANNRIAPNTALNLVLLGVSLLLLARKRAPRFMQGSSFLSILIALLAILGYAYSVKNLYGFLSYTPMALNTAINFLMVSLALCFASADSGYMKVFAARTTGGLNARRLLPAVIIVPSVLSALALAAIKQEYFNTEYALSLLTVFTIFIFTILVFILTASLNKLDEKKEMIEAALEMSKKKVEAANAELDKRIEGVEKQNESLSRTKSAMLNVMEDLGEEKGKLEIGKAKDEAMLSSIGEGLAATDAEGKVIVINRVALEMLRAKEEEVVGKRWAIDVPKVQDERGDAVSPERLVIVNALNNRKRSTGDYFYTRLDGTRFPVFVTAAPVVTGDKVIGAIVVFRDVTKEKDVDRAKTEFVSLASHQLRTPLSAINWYIEMLLNGDAGVMTDEQVGYLKEVAESNRRMVDLVGSLLNVSRIDLGTFAVDPVPTNLVEVAESILKEVTPQYTAKKQTLDREFAPDLPVIIADPKLIRIVFQNFLTNAIKYTPEAGVITFSLSVRQKEQDILVRVKDTGYGIPRDAQDKIFQKLFRADNVREKETDGTGLGLYIIKAIIEQSGGKVWFESEENKGSTFYASIPLEGMKKKTGTKGLS